MVGEALLVGGASVSSSRPVFVPYPLEFQGKGLEAEVWPPASGDGPLADLAFPAGGWWGRG